MTIANSDRRDISFNNGFQQMLLLNVIWLAENLKLYVFGFLKLIISKLTQRKNIESIFASKLSKRHRIAYTAFDYIADPD